MVLAPRMAPFLPFTPLAMPGGPRIVPPAKQTFQGQGYDARPANLFPEALRGSGLEGMETVMIRPAVFVDDGGIDFAALVPVFDVGMGCERSRPGDVAVAIGIQGIAPLAENPLGTTVGLAQSEVIRGNILLAFREAFFGRGELVHEGETEVMLFRSEIDFEEATRKLFGRFPTNLAAEAGFVPSPLDGVEMAQEIKENGFEKVPVFGADGQERAERQLGGSSGIPAGCSENCVGYRAGGRHPTGFYGQTQ